MKSLIILVLILSHNIFYSQSYSGIAIYGINNNLDVDTELKKSNGNKKVERALKTIIKNSKKNDDITFELKFNSNESLCRYIDKIKKNENAINIIAIDAKQRGIVFTDFKEKKIFIKKPDDEDEFLIEKKWGEYKWKLLNERKKIGKYNCFKAVGEKKIFRKRTGKYKLSKVIAWYSPEINISSGPVQYAGLPGLIIELTEEKGINFYLKKITIKKDIIKIKKPKARKTLTQKEYDLFQRKFYLVNRGR